MHLNLVLVVLAAAILSVGAMPQLSDECKKNYGDFPIYTGPCEDSSELVHEGGARTGHDADVVPKTAARRESTATSGARAASSTRVSPSRETRWSLADDPPPAGFACPPKGCACTSY